MSKLSTLIIVLALATISSATEASGLRIATRLAPPVPAEADDEAAQNKFIWVQLLVYGASSDKYRKNPADKLLIGSSYSSEEVCLEASRNQAVPYVLEDDDQIFCLPVRAYTYK